MLGLARAAQLARAIGDSPASTERRAPIASSRKLRQRIKPPVAAKPCQVDQVDQDDQDDQDADLVTPALSA
jgi:hypothetical protein